MTNSPLPHPEINGSSMPQICGKLFDNTGQPIFIQNFVSQSYLLQGYVKFILTSHECYPITWRFTHLATYSKVKVPTLTQTWSEIITLRISCPGHISYKGMSNQLKFHMIITHSMKVRRAQNLATYIQGRGHNYDSNMISDCYVLKSMSRPYLLQE